MTSISQNFKNLFSKTNLIENSLDKFTKSQEDMSRSHEIKIKSILVHYFPRIIITLIIIGLYIFFGSNILSMTYDQILKVLSYFQNYLGPIGVYVGTPIIFGFLFLILFTAIFQKEGSDTVRKELLWGFWILIIVIVFGIILNSDFAQLYSTQEQTNIVAQEGQSRWDAIVERLTCWDPTCLNKEINKDKVTTASASKYYLRLDKNSIIDYSYSYKELERPLPLYYDFTSTGNLKIDKIDCYINDRLTDPFYTEILSDKIKTNADEKIAKTYYCKNMYETISKLQDKKEIEYTIITVLSMSLDLTYNQVIPIINYQKALEELSLSNSYSNTYILQKLKESNLFDENKDMEFLESSNFFDIDKNVKRELPLFFGDDENKEFPIPITFSSKDTSLGKFISGQVTDLIKPISLDYLEGVTVEDYKKQIKNTDNKFKLDLWFKENENSIDTSFQLLTKQNLEINMNVNFEKEDRFKLKVIEENFNINQSNSNISTN